jgi:sugar lactone lactonase YvrE
MIPVTNTPTTRRLRVMLLSLGASAALSLGGSAAAPPPASAPTATPAASPMTAPAPNPAGTTICPEQREALEAIAAALGRRPEDATLHFFRARVWALCGNAPQTVDALAAVAQYGAGFLPTKDIGFERVWDDPAFRAQMAKLEAALPRVDQAPVAFRLSDRQLIPEGIAWDATRRRLFIGSTARGEVYVVEGGKKEARFAGGFPGLGQVLGLALDGKRRRLFAVATNAIVPPAAAPPANAVVELDADSGRLLRRLDAAGANQLNDVAVAPDGTVFASDSGNGGIWRATPNDSKLTRWLDDGTLPGANGVAVSNDGKALFVAHTTGVARVELASATVLARIANPTRETLAAIDGLYVRGNTLIGVQNVTTPGRVIEMTLDAAGTGVTAVSTLLSHHHPALDEPTTGAVDGDRFLLLADSFVGRLGADGTIRDPGTLVEPTILAVPLTPRL